jgi:hypothetical protein
MKFDRMFEQYLLTTKIPVFTWHQKQDVVFYRWEDCVKNFDMPVKVCINNKLTTLHPSTKWKKIKLESKFINLQVDRNYLVNVKNDAL